MHPLKKAREHAGLSVRKAAKLIGVSPSTIIDWEKDETQPKLPYLVKMADGYQGIPLDTLVGRATPEGYCCQKSGAKPSAPVA